MSVNLIFSTESFTLWLCRARGYGLTKQQALDIVQRTFASSTVKSAKFDYHGQARKESTQHDDQVDGLA